MLNATVDITDMLDQVVNRFTHNKHKHLCHTGNVIIQRYVLFCKIVYSAEQSKHQLLVLLLKKFHIPSGRCYPLTLVPFFRTVILEKVIEYGETKINRDIANSNVTGFKTIIPTFIQNYKLESCQDFRLKTVEYLTRFSFKMLNCGG
jgi:hypothetical protein